MFAVSVAPTPVTRAKGHAKPRVAPPTPVRHGAKDFKAFSSSIGIDLFPWQETASRYITAQAPGGKWMYPEVAIIVARQNGKTTLLIPYIARRLLDGARIMHTAQNRELPREVFGAVADLMLDRFRDELRAKPRFANGQEEIKLRNGGTYRIVAPTRGGARGPSNDVVIIDELREMDTHEFIAAAKPTLTASANPQMLYLSNAGTESSEVLNALRKRGAEDPSLAYLEWSAAPEREPGDVAGWREANPSIGHIPQALANIEREFRAHSLADTLAIFETEHLCRWVKTIAPPLVPIEAWQRAKGEVGRPRRPHLAVSMDQSSTRASAVVAWQEGEQIALGVVADVTGDPIDTARFGDDLRKLALRLGVIGIAFDAWTDSELAKYLRRPRNVSGREYANASENFSRLVESGRLVWAEAEQITADLPWTARKTVANGSWMAVKAHPDHPATAAIAAVRAAWLASGPLTAKPRIF